MNSGPWPNPVFGARRTGDATVTKMALRSRPQPPHLAARLEVVKWCAGVAEWCRVGRPTTFVRGGGVVVVQQQGFFKVGRPVTTAVGKSSAFASLAPQHGASLETIRNTLHGRDVSPIGAGLEPIMGGLET